MQAKHEAVLPGTIASPTNNMNQTVHRLIAMLLMLWLPLQAAAGVGAYGAAGHHGVRAAATAQVAPPDGVHPAAQVVAHAASHAASLPDHTTHHGADPSGSSPQADSPSFGSSRCGDCVMCVALVQSLPVTGHGGRLRSPFIGAGDESFTSVGSDPAVEPPIAAA